MLLAFSVEPLRWRIVPVVLMSPASASMVPRCSKFSAEIVKVPAPVCSIVAPVSFVSMLPVPVASAMSPSLGTVMRPWLKIELVSSRKIEFEPLMDTVPATVPPPMGSTKSVRPLRSVRELSTSRRASDVTIVCPRPWCTLPPVIRAVPVSTRSPVPSTVPPDCRKSLRKN